MMPPWRYSLALVTGLLALPEPAAATIDQDPPLACGTGATYYPNNGRWAPLPDPDGSGIRPLYYFQAAAGSDDLPGRLAQETITRAMETWNAGGKCGGRDHGIQVKDGYRTFRDLQSQLPIGDYETASSGDICTGTDEQRRCTFYQNTFYFIESNFGGDSKTLAVTLNAHTPNTKHMVDSDIVFNGQFFDWRASQGGSNRGCDGTGAKDCYHLIDVALHEIGHFFGFHHVQCTQALMFSSGNPSLNRTNLTVHEQTGVCAVYPEQSQCTGADCAHFGEQCNTSSNCKPANGRPGLCVSDVFVRTYQSNWRVNLDNKNAVEVLPYSYCSTGCTSTRDCQVGFSCLDNGNNLRFCGPGPNLTGDSDPSDCICDTTSSCDTNCGHCDTDCTTDPGPGDPGDEETNTGFVDLCNPCANGTQCLSGYCAILAADEKICTGRCFSDGENNSCPSGFECTGVDGNDSLSVCIPKAGTNACGATSEPAEGTKLNEQCYRGSTTKEGDFTFEACAGDLVCFGFRSNCVAEQIGQCVNSCTRNNPCPEGLDCCYRVGDDGECIRTPDGDQSQEITVGGCFNLGEEGESCVAAESAICKDDHLCLFFNNEPSTRRCYKTCGGACTSGSACTNVTLDGGCGRPNVCCTDEGLTSGDCFAGEPETLAGIGLECFVHEDCDSNLCLRTARGAAYCSRSCDPVTKTGCPADNADLNGDGKVDGGFNCIRNGRGGGQCEPKNGPIFNPRLLLQRPEPTSGCCNAAGLGREDIWLYSLAALPLLWWRRRQRRVLP